MDRQAWEAYRAMPPGPRKRAAQAKLVAGEENLIQYLVSRFIAGSRYHTDELREDLAQAARIGAIRAIDAWDPPRGPFLTVIWGWAKHEMQSVIERSALPITVPRRAHLPKAKQDAIAAFYAQHGRDPDPEELRKMGISGNDHLRSQRAAAAFTGAHDGSADMAAEEDESPEEAIDRKRDEAALVAFTKGLKPAEREDFWAGKRPDLVEKAREYVERRRSVRVR